MDCSRQSPTPSWPSLSSGNTLIESPVATPSSLNIDVEDSENFITAVLSGNISEVRFLAINGVYISPFDSWVIYEACMQGPDMISAFTANPRLNINQPMPSQLGATAMHFLLRTAPARFQCGKKETITALLQQGSVNLGDQDQRGNNALHILAALPWWSDCVEIMKLLLCDIEGIPPTVRIRCATHINARNWPKTNNDIGDTPLTLAILSNNIGCVQLLLDSGANPLAIGKSGQEPLEFAVSQGYYDIAAIVAEYVQE